MLARDVDESKLKFPSHGLVVNIVNNTVQSSQLRG